MRILLGFFMVFAALGCSDEIGDSCGVSSDCSPDGDRICDSTQPGGYCTVIGCNESSCPDSSVCVRFFSITSSNLPCDAATEDDTTNDCAVDEICTLAGSCVPRSAEQRFCMASCNGSDDCRGDYECRDEALMREHGGEPVTDSEILPSFCAAAPS